MTHFDESNVIIRGARVVTCAPSVVSFPQAKCEIGPFEGSNDACVVVRNGRVVEVAPDWGHEFPERFRGAHIYEAWGKVLTPALIDCHTHPAFVSGRSEEWLMKLGGASYESIAAKGGGILSSVRAVRARHGVQLEQSVVGNLRRLRNHGVAVIEAKSGYGLSLDSEVAQLREIQAAAKEADVWSIRTCLAAHTIPEEYRNKPTGRVEYIDLVCNSILPEVAKRGWATRADVFCERGVFTPEETRRVGLAAKAAGLALTVHADQLSHSGGTRVACELGAQSADHLEYIDDADIAALKASGIVAVLLPGSTFFLRQDKWAPARKLLDAGVTVALATDFNPGSSPICNPTFIMHLAMRHLGMTWEECLAGFTVNAAKALGLNTAEWGTIQPGSRAAFAIWDVDHPRELPYYVGSNLCAGVITCRGWRD